MLLFLREEVIKKVDLWAHFDMYKSLFHLDLQVILELTDMCSYIPYIGMRHMGPSKPATAYIIPNLD